MSTPATAAVALDFVKHINARDVMGLARLMTEDHQFIDATGTVHPGRAAMVEGWKKYFATFQDYQIQVDEVVAQDNLVVMFGNATGVCDGHAFSIPVAWKATVRENSIAEWRVYADVEPMFKAMGKPRS